MRPAPGPCAAVAGAMLAAVPAIAATAQFEGLYRGGPDWDCETVGAPDGAVQVAGERFFGIEGTCHLLNPMPVRGLDAVLFDGVCGTGSGVENLRMMLMHAEGGGLIVVTDGRAVHYSRCPASR